jgi:prostaglandin-E synthase 1
MESFLNNPTFVVYAVACIVLSFNLLAVWTYSGVARGKTKTAINPEDAATFGSGLNPVDPPEVARVLRAHANANALIVPFLFLGLVYVLAGGTPRFAKIDFAVFVVGRLGHSIAYLGGKQPWRTIFFTLSGLGFGVLIVQVSLLVIRGH